MKKIVGAASIVTAMVLSGCAGRGPQPVAVVQPQDRYADCAAIIAEVQANNQKVGDLAGDEGGKVAQNVAAGVVGLFVWPVLFGMDFQGTAGKEVAALQSRQQYLAVLAEQRNCGGPSAIPSQPAVATSPPATVPAPPRSPVAVSAPAPVAPAVAVAPAVPAPPQPVAAVSPPAAIAIPAPAATPVPVAVTAPAMPGAASDRNSYEEAQQQYRQAEQQYQRQLEQQRAQGR
jgi:hypothetical protein